jgi:hypothetical protein
MRFNCHWFVSKLIICEISINRGRRMIIEREKKLRPKFFSSVTIFYTQNHFFLKPQIKPTTTHRTNPEQNLFFHSFIGQKAHIKIKKTLDPEPIPSFFFRPEISKSEQNQRKGRNFVSFFRNLKFRSRIPRTLFLKTNLKSEI